MHKKEFSLHTHCLAASFLLGNAVITIPFSGADRSNLTAFFAAFLIALPIYCAFVFILNKTKAPDSRIKKLLFSVTCAILIVPILFIAADCFDSVCRYIAEDILPQSGIFYIRSVFIVSAAWFSFQKSSAGLKFALFSFFLFLIIIPTLFIAAIPRLNPDTVVLLKIPELKSLARQTIYYLWRVFLPPTVVLLYEKKVFGAVRLKRSLSGLAAGTAVLSLCLMSSIMLFGATLAGETEFPYAASISTVTVGNLFTRMDGFAYFVFFSSCLIKVTVCLYTARKLLFSVGFKYKKAACILTAAAVWLISYI